MEIKVYNKEKTEILSTYDLEKGYLKRDKIIKVYPEIVGRKEKGHYETIAIYPNGGKDVKWVIDEEEIKHQPQRIQEEDIFVYMPFTVEELLSNEKQKLRKLREEKCFPIINRGQFWFDRLTVEQKSELNVWYQKWLDVTHTKIVPETPSWIK